MKAAQLIKPKSTTEPKPTKRLSKKELAKQFRHETYQRAKEYRKTDPRQIAMKEKQKEQQKVAYQKGKERRKAYQDEIKKASKARSAATKTTLQQKNLKAMIAPASTIKNNVR